MTELKVRPNHKLYLSILRRLSPEARLRKAFELSALSRALFRAGLTRRFPDLSRTQLRNLELKRLERCHNRNY